MIILFSILKKINCLLYFRCTLSQIWGNFSTQTLIKIASVHDVGLPLKSEADLLVVEEWIGNCSYGTAYIIREWYSTVYMLLLKQGKFFDDFFISNSYSFNNHQINLYLLPDLHIYNSFFLIPTPNIKGSHSPFLNQMLRFDERGRIVTANVPAEACSILVIR